MKTKNRRLLAFPIMILIFAIAVCSQIAAAAGSIDAAAIGTAALTDAGDTVFIREAVFTIGTEQITAAGYTVGNYGTAENPTANVDINTLTPITKAAPLTGTISKNIYVCGAETADIYLGDLKLTSGHSVTGISGVRVNFLGPVETFNSSAQKYDTTGNGKLTTDALSADLLNFSRVTAVIGSDVNDFSSVQINCGSDVTVNGDMISSKAAKDAWDSGIGVGSASKLSVTGDVKTQKWVHFSDKSVGTIGGSAESGINFGATGKSSVSVNGSVSSMKYLDFVGADSVTVGGSATAQNFWVAASTSSFGGDVTASGSIFIEGGTNIFEKDLKKTSDSDVFLINRSSKTVIKGSVVSSGNFDMGNATVEIGGDITVSSGICPIRGSTLTVQGNADINYFNPLHLSTVTIGKNLDCRAGLFNIGSSSVTVNGDLNAHGADVYVFGRHYVSSTDVYSPSSLTVEGAVNDAHALLAYFSSSLTAGGVSNSDQSALDSVGAYSGSQIKLAGPVSAGNLCATNNDSYTTGVAAPVLSKIEITGDLTLGSWFHIFKGDTLTVGGNMAYNASSGCVEGSVNVAGDLANEAASGGLAVKQPGSLTVGGDADFSGLLLNQIDSSANSLYQFNTIAVKGSIQSSNQIVTITGLPDNASLDVGGNTLTSDADGKIIYSNIGDYDSLVIKDASGTSPVYYSADTSDKSVDSAAAESLAKTDFTITYVLNGGRFAEGLAVKKTYTVDEISQSEIPLPSDTASKTDILSPEHAGTFLGWYENRDFSGNPSAAIPRYDTGDKTFYASWQTDTYTLNLHINLPGDSAVKTYTLAYPEILSLDHQFSAAGRQLLYWTANSGGTGTRYSGNVSGLVGTNGGSIGLYAQWKANSYNIAFDGNGGSASVQVPALKAEYGSDAVLPDNPFSRPGYRFAGWNTEKDGSGESFAAKGNVRNLTDKDGATVLLYAQWKKISAGSSASAKTLTFETNGGTEIAGLKSEIGTMVDLSRFVPKKDGFTFDGWYSSPEFNDKLASIKITGDATVYAKWRRVNSFADVSETDWFSSDVQYVNENGLMQGTSGTTFDPYLTTTRGMIVTILYRFRGEPAVTGACPFDDVKSGSYCENAVAWAAENKIVDGFSNGRFGPDEPITREQMAAILYRFAKYMKYDTTQGGMAIREYSDYARISSYAAEAMSWAVNAGLLQGNNRSLMPQGSAMRAQAAAILHRFCEKIAK
jgi:uncharacterized repeat protein (TIGR02543 family)